MVLYFSGTGNSAYVAERTARIIGDKAENLFDRIKNKDFSPIYSDSPFVISAPTYAWRIPRILKDYLEKTPLTGNGNIYFLMTCGDDVGNAEKHLKKLCKKTGKNYMGCAYFRMPENYIAMFSSPNDEQALRIIGKSKAKIDEAAKLISSGNKLSEIKVNIVGRLKSGIVNELFYPFCVSAKKFYSTDKCVSCGKCEKVCPLSNISIENGKPIWGKDCTHCMACICKCPTEAIEYGKVSIGQNRYVCKADFEK